MFYSSVPRQRPAGVLASSLTPRWQRALAGPRWSIGGQRCAGQLSAAQSRCAPPFACDRPAIDPIGPFIGIHWPGPRLAHLSSQQRRPHPRRVVRPSLPPLGIASRVCCPTSHTRVQSGTRRHFTQISALTSAPPVRACLLCRPHHKVCYACPSAQTRPTVNTRVDTAARN